MKYFYLVLIIVFASVSCKKEIPIDYAIVSGKILNSDAKKLKISSSDRKINKEIIVDNDGNFNDTLKNVKAGVFSFYDGKNYNNFYGVAGNNIIINYDAKDFDNTLIFSGKGGEVSNYLLAKKKLTNELVGDRVEYFKLDETEYKAKSQKNRDVILSLISSFEGLSDTYVKNEKKDVNYSYLNSLNSFEYAHGYYTENQNYKVSDTFLDEFKGFDFNLEEDYFTSQYYTYLVSSHYRKLGREFAESNQIDNSLAYLKIIGDIPSKKIMNALLSEQIESVKYSENMKEYFDMFMKISTDDADKKALAELYEKVKILAVGNSSPKFIDYENNAGGTTSLDDLKGKYIYIDVWATWCGPCIGEIPSLKKVEKKYHNKNITFLSLSIDKAKDHDKWKKMIVDKELGGMQLLADDAWGSKFVQDYQIKGIPHFILLDPEGKIVKYSAPRPSSDKLIELFDKLNI